MKKVLLLLMSACAIGTDAGAQMLWKQKDKVFNYGVKPGLHSVMPFDGQITLDGRNVNSLRPIYGTGRAAELLMRINIARFFIQPAIAWEYCSMETRFSDAGNGLHAAGEQDAARQEHALSMQFVSLETPVVAGFYILKDNPYALSIMSGVNTKFTYDARFTLNSAGISNLRRDSPRYDLSVYSALEVMIGRLIFDFGYEYGLNRSMYEMNMHMQGLPHPVAVRAGQRVKCLSMSVGVLF
jgi:hypothetical protein